MNRLAQVQEFGPKSYGQFWLGFGFEGLFALFVGAMMLQGNAAGIGLGIVVIVLGVGLPVGYWLYLTNTRLLIGPGTVGYQDMWGRRRQWSTAEIERTVQLTIVYRSRYGAVPKRALLLVGADGRCLQKVRMAQWSEEAIDAFSAASGRQPEYFEAYTTTEAAKAFPGSVGWMYAHPVQAGVVIMGIFLALAGALEAYLLFGRR